METVNLPILLDRQVYICILTMKNKRNYFYFLMTFLLFWVFVYFAFESWDKYKAARVSTNVREQKLLHLQYPSVTVCPEKTFNTVQRIPSSPTTFEAVRQFYLDNVRSLQELKAMFSKTTTSYKYNKEAITMDSLLVLS